MENITKSVFIKCETLAILKANELNRGKKYNEYFDRFVKTWASYFEEQANDYIEFLDNNPQMFIEIQKIANDEDFRDEVMDELADTYLLGMTLQEVDVQEQLTIGLSFDIVNEDAVEWAKSRVGELIRWVNETTQKEIQLIIENALTNGMTMKDLKDEIFRKFAEYSEYRANLIAVMEMWNSFEQGKKAQFWKYTQEFWVTGFKKSFNANDSNTRETHKENTKAGWIRANQLFPWTLTDTAPHGFNCRCNVRYSLYNLDEEKPQFL